MFASRLIYLLVALNSPYLVAQTCDPAWLDSSLNNGLSNSVRVLENHNDGQGETLYAGGSIQISTSNGSTTGVARWTDSQWELVGGSISRRVLDMRSYNDGSGSALYVAGEFTEIGGEPFKHLARWDGSQWQAVGGGFSGPVNALEVHDDGEGPQLYAGGRFVSAGDEVVNRVAKWTGVEWVGLGGGLNGSVESLVSVSPSTSSESILIASGLFTVAGDTQVSGFAIWDGQEWRSLGANSDYGGDVTAYANSMAVDRTDPAGDILYIGGIFTSINQQIVNYVASWDGVNWSGLSSGVGELVLSLNFIENATADEGVLFVGGGFSSADAKAANAIVRWDGLEWQPMQDGVSGGFRPQVYDTILFDDGSGTGPAVIVGGDFSEASGVPSSSIAKWGCTGGGQIIFLDKFSQ